MNFTDFQLYLIAGFLALIPAIVWLTIIFKRTKRKGIQILLFFGSVFSVVPVFLLQYLLNLFPQFDIAKVLGSQIENQSVNFIILFICVGIVEEIVKQLLIRLIDRKYLLIQTINDSIRFGLIGALGFSFAENIFYIYNIYTQLGIQQLFIAYLFRSIFTTCAHMIFSGFFGYYYGIAKFSINIIEQSRWTGKKMRFISFLSRVFETSKIQIYKELKILKGLFIAIVLHAAFNFFLQLNQILPVVLYIVVMGIMLIRLLKRRAGKLIMITDPTEQRASTMASKDEEVVIELMGMWFNTKRYVDVIHICQRLLQRDPDNKIVQMFKAQAMDKMKEGDSYSKILQNIFPEKELLTIDKLSIQKSKEEQQTFTQTAPLPSVPQGAPGQSQAAPASKDPPRDEKFFDLKI